MPRRHPLLTQADIERTIRAAKKLGADRVEVRCDGSLVVSLKEVPLAPEPESDLEQWRREDARKKTSGCTHRAEDAE